MWIVIWYKRGAWDRVPMLDALKEIDEIRALLRTLAPPVRSGPAMPPQTDAGGKRVLHIF